MIEADSLYSVCIYIVLFGLTLLLSYLFLWMHEILHWLPSKAMGLNPKILFKHKIVPSEVDDDFPVDIKPNIQDKILLLYLPYLIGLPVVFALFLLGCNTVFFPLIISCSLTMIWHIYTYPRENFYYIDHPEGGESIE